MPVVIYTIADREALRYAAETGWRGCLEGLAGQSGGEQPEEQWGNC